MSDFTPHEAHEEVAAAATEQEFLIRRLIALCDGSGVNAVLAVARLADVAVVWEDRHEIENRLEVEFTDEQWARIAVHLEDFDEFTDAGGTWEGRREFAEHVLSAAGLALVGDYGDGFEVVDVSGGVEPRG